MAKVKFGAVVSDTRGSVEGITFSRGRAGAVVRRKASPSLQQTVYTQPVRVGLATLSRRWFAELSQLQRDAWIALADANPVTDVFGNSFLLTGQQLYNRVNQIRRQAGLGALDSAPADQVVLGLETLSVSAEAPATLTVSYTATPLAAGYRLYLFSTACLSPGKIARKSDARFLGVSVEEAGSPFAAGTLYTGRFGNLIVGRMVTVFVGTLRADRGAISPMLLGSSVVEAA